MRPVLAEQWQGDVQELPCGTRRNPTIFQLQHTTPARCPYQRKQQERQKERWRRRSDDDDDFDNDTRGKRHLAVPFRRVARFWHAQ